ncbi:hypothetical protein OHS59_12175 [Streptomyces sp. NBC_00414]|uniref:hypothetical protein n=1 Tax=Streptomyces sp. NBC_00414 TaxID=2975739 RepID=UPI002E1EC9D7
MVHRTLRGSINAYVCVTVEYSDDDRHVSAAEDGQAFGVKASVRYSNRQAFVDVIRGLAPTTVRGFPPAQ